jgi:tetratricopeptide (TPR) repeat protein
LLQEQRLQSYAAWSTGTFHAMRGDGEAAIEACQRGLDCAPDPLAIMTALGFLGYAHLEKDEYAAAMAHLEEAVQRARHFQFRPILGWFLAWWGEANLLHGHLQAAHAHASEGLTMSRDIGFRWNSGLAQRTLGRIEREQGHLEIAGEHLQDALQTFTVLQSKFDVGRTHFDLASLAHTRGHPDTATAHLSTAYAWFKKLQVPKWAERTEQVARDYGVALTEVVLEGGTEGSP